MVEQQSSGLAVRQSIVVQAPRERAFEVFTAGHEQVVAAGVAQDRRGFPAIATVIEPRAGGRWFEQGDDGGSECDWGQGVAVWDPPGRVVLMWQLSAEFKYDRRLHTEIEVRFRAEDDDRTRVELEHRRLENYGERAERDARDPRLRRRLERPAAPVRGGGLRCCRWRVLVLEDGPVLDA